MHSGNLTLRVNDEEVTFNIYHTMKFPNEAQSCNRISMVDYCVKGVIDGGYCVMILWSIVWCIHPSRNRVFQLQRSELVVMV